MKKLWLFWWMANIFWAVIFVVGTAFIWFREVDGAGVTQTPALKLVTFFVFIIAFIFPVMLQVVWLIVNLVIKWMKRSR
ncbi:DUF3923 family protein [Bacillus pumilus]|nr:DUF3923 family protein [Bacillus pumilus]